jgi:hypothetical protein
MNFQLSNLFQNQNRITVTGQTGTGNVTNQNTVASSGKSLSDFVPGSSLNGQVVETKDGTVTIQLADSSLISASLKDGIFLEAGSQVTFLVNSNHNNQIVLSPLFTNLGASPNVENALKAADIPINAQSTAMVADMMEQGMSIDKNSLLSMYKEIVNNPQIDGSTVVRLSQMQLAVNELNASQLQDYENLQHQLSGSIEEIADGITQLFASVENGANLEDKIQLFDGIVDLLQAAGNDEVIEGEQGTTQQTVQQITPQTEQVQQAAAAAQQGEQPTVAAASTGGQAISELLSGKDLQELADILKSAGTDEAVTDTLVKGEISSKEALQLLNDSMQKVMSSDEGLPMQEQTELTAWKELMSHPAVGRLLTDALQKNWLLEPQEVADKENVERFYEQLKSQTGKLADLTASVLGKDAPLSQNVSQLSQNIDFLNQLNQTFTYVQIPLKMSGQDANGDLYVYTNKKNLAAKNGSVSAFLHLDMDYLGSVDVFVTMENQKVSTNFKVQDDETLDLIEANIDLLNERLQKRGYQLRTTVEKQEEETSVLKEMQKQMGQNSMPIAQFSFDARA